VVSTEGYPYAREWYLSPGCAAPPQMLRIPDQLGVLCTISLGYPSECVTYAGRYWHEVAPGLNYVDVQYFQLATTCLDDFIFSNGFENGTTNQWSVTIN
jgi:hypothetical protein